MRALLLLAAACGCAGAPAAARRETPACDSLPLLGAAGPEAISAGADGSLAVVGTFKGPLRAGSAALDGGGGFVLRTDPDGSVRWLRALPHSRLHAVATLPDGDVVVAGDASAHCLTARFSPGGDLRWRTAAGGETSSCRALAAAGRTVWVAGEFTGVLSPTVASRGSSDVFLAQLSETGMVGLVSAFGGRGREVARAVAVATGGDVVLAGQFGGDVDASVSEVDFGKGKVRSAGDFDGFVVAVGPDGKTRWASTFGDNGDDGIAALAVGIDRAIYAAGHHQPSADHRGLVAHDAGNANAALLRFSGEGRGEWVKIFDGPSSEAVGLAFDPAGRLWMAGQFLSELRLGALSLTGGGKEDVFALAVAPVSGELLGARSWGGSERETLAGIAAIPGGIALAGQTRGEMLACQKPIGSPGEETGFVLWLRDLAPR